MKKQLTLKTCVASIWNEYKVFCCTHVFCEQYHATQSQATQSRMCINLMVKMDQQEATKQFQIGWFHKVPRNLIM